jgi:hypothetical protein
MPIYIIMETRLIGVKVGSGHDLKWSGTITLLM